MYTFKANTNQNLSVKHQHFCGDHPRIARLSTQLDVKTHTDQRNNTSTDTSQHTYVIHNSTTKEILFFSVCLCFSFVQLGVVWVGELGDGPVIWELFSYEQAFLGMLRRHFGNLWRRSLENDTVTFGKIENLMD